MEAIFYRLARDTAHVDLAGKIACAQLTSGA